MTKRSGASRLLLVDDHELFRKGLASLISRSDGMEVVGEASTGQEALRLTVELEPDLVLLDLSLPGLTGTEVARRILADHPRVKVIIVSMHTDEEHVARCLKLGVSGYLLKSSSADELEIAVHAAERGETYLTPGVSRRVVEQYLQHSPGVEDPLSVLTSRQREVLQLLAEGKSMREIAQTLHLSIKTVESHRANIMDRLDLRDLASLVRFAVRAGLVGARGGID